MTEEKPCRNLKDDGELFLESFSNEFKEYVREMTYISLDTEVQEFMKLSLEREESIRMELEAVKARLQNCLVVRKKQLVNFQKKFNKIDNVSEEVN